MYILFTIVFYQVTRSLLDGHASVLTNLLVELSKLLIVDKDTSVKVRDKKC